MDRGDVEAVQPGQQRRDEHGDLATTQTELRTPMSSSATVIPTATPIISSAVHRSRWSWETPTRRRTRNGPCPMAP